jgi:hypothetical protein
VTLTRRRDVVVIDPLREIAGVILIVDPVDGPD